MWTWNIGERIDIIFPGELSFSLAVPLRFAEEPEGKSRVGWAGIGGPGSQGCVSVSWVSLKRWPSATQRLASTWSKSGMLHLPFWLARAWGG